MLFIGGSKDSQEGIDVSEMVLHALQSVGLVIKLGQAMSRAVDNAEDLRERYHEVEDLREEEK